MIVPIRNPQYLDSENSIYQIVRRSGAGILEYHDPNTNKEIDIFVEVTRPKDWVDAGADQIWIGGVDLQICRLEYKCYPKVLEKRYHWHNKDNVSKQLANSAMILSTDVVCNSVSFEEMEDLRYGVGSLMNHPFQDAGRGCVLFVAYPLCYSSLAVVNFTGSKLILSYHEALCKARRRGDGHAVKGIRKERKYRLAKIGKIIQPVTSQFIFLCIEAYIRQDFNTLYKYILNGESKGLIILGHDGDKELLEWLRKDAMFSIGKASGLADLRKLWFGKMIHKLLSIIHIDNLATPKGKDRYQEYVEAVREGKLLEFLAKLK